MQFLSAEAAGILEIKEIGQLKIFIIERFKPMLDHAVKSDSTLPDRAKTAIATAWYTSI